MKINIQKLLFQARSIFSAAQFKLSRFLLYLKDFIKKKWWRVLLVFLPPVVFAWPLLSGFLPFPLRGSLLLQQSSQRIGASDSPQKTMIRGTTDSLGGKNIFSSLFKVETISSMPVELCLFNQNKIFDGENEIDYKDISDKEVGAMNIKFHTVSNNESKEIYAKIGDTNCETLQSDGVTIDKEFEVRNPLPVEAKTSLREGKILVSLEKDNKVVGVFNRPAFFYIKWRTAIFLKNLIIFTFAWWIFLSSCISLWKFINKKDR